MSLPCPSRMMDCRDEITNWSPLLQKKLTLVFTCYLFDMGTETIHMIFLTFADTIEIILIFNICCVTHKIKKYASFLS